MFNNKNPDRSDMIARIANPRYRGRLSSALARTVPKGGKANVFITKEAAANPLSIWNKFEKPILIDNNVFIKYNWVK